MDLMHTKGFGLVCLFVVWLLLASTPVGICQNNEITPVITSTMVSPVESYALDRMFMRVEKGIVFCHSSGNKTTGIFVSKDGWIVTAGHKVDPDFPAAEPIHVKLTRAANAETFISTQILQVAENWDLPLFKIDYKPKYYFKKFAPIYKFQENWVFGFRMTSGKVPSPPGYVTSTTKKGGLLLTTAPTINGNSGSPVLNRNGGLLGLLVMGYPFGDGLFIPSKVIKEYIKENIK